MGSQELANQGCEASSMKGDAGISFQLPGMAIFEPLEGREASSVKGDAGISSPSGHF